MHNLTLSGGTEKLRALASLNYTDQEGVFPDTYMKRYSVRVNTDYKFNDKLSAGIDISGRHSVVSEPGSDVASIIGAVRRTAPIYPWVTPNGNPAYVQIELWRIRNIQTDLFYRRVSYFHIHYRFLIPVSIISF